MTKTIGVAVDSPADFPPGVVKQLDLNICPVHILVDGADYLHGVNITNKQVIDYLKNKRDVSTSPLLPNEFADIFENLTDRYDHLISLHISSKLSGNFASAKNSLRLLYPDQADRITLIDTGNVTVGQGLLAKRAVELIRKGVPAEEIEAKLKPYMEHGLLFFAVDNLFWLKRSGKLTGFSAMMGSLLNVKPIINLQDTKLVAAGTEHGKVSAVNKLINLATETALKQPADYEIWVGHADALESAVYVQTRVASALDIMMAEIQIAEVGPTIAAHAGPGSLCLGMLRR